MSNVAFTYEDAFYIFENKCKLIQHINEVFPQLYEPYAISLISELEQLKKNAGTALEEIEFLNHVRIMEPDFGLNAYKNFPVSPIAKKLRDELSDKSNFIHGSEIFLREMSLVYLITIFEEFIYDILLLFYLRHPNNLKKQKIKINKEILATGNNDKIEGNKIYNKINSFLKQNVEVLNDKLLEEFNLDLKNQIDWVGLVECFEHRHVIVHNDGYPDEKYKLKTSYSGYMGDRLSTTEEYIKNSLIIFQNSAKIIRDHFVKKYPFYDRFSSDVPTENRENHVP